MLSKYKLNQLYFKDTQFANLMTRRIFNVLLIANPYDAFMLEDDGRIDEKIFNEYTSLSLRYPPRFSQVHILTISKRHSSTFVSHMVKHLKTIELVYFL